jgi:hypothetical protein
MRETRRFSSNSALPLYCKSPNYKDSAPPHTVVCTLELIGSSALSSVCDPFLYHTVIGNVAENLPNGAVNILSPECLVFLLKRINELSVLLERARDYL